MTRASPVSTARHGWTTDDDAMLRRMAGEGHSASQIAQALGGKTRSAVLGRAHRQSINMRSGLAPQAAKTLEGRLVTGKTRLVAKPAPKPARPAAPISSALPRPPAPVSAVRADKAFDPAAFPAARLVRLEDLEAGMCKWPLFSGDEPRRFCGLGTVQVEGKCARYCAAHALMSGARK